MGDFVLTSENYFSPEANALYMSSTQFKAFRRCESAALAEVRGLYTPPNTAALTFGSLVDAYFSGTLGDYLEEHPELLTRGGMPKAEVRDAIQLAERLTADDLFRMLMDGAHQEIRTGYIAGVPFKIKIDSLLDRNAVREIISRFPETAPVFGFGDGAIIDLKIIRNLANLWSDDDHEYVHFTRYWGYDIQGAIYQAVEGHMLPFILAVGTKEPVPDLEAMYIPDGDLADRLCLAEDLAPRYQAIKEGRENPSACGRCPWCRSNKHLNRIIHYREV